MMRLGIFGGTFDPPHIGHLIIAEAAADQLELDRVLWLPAAQPPHKPDGAAASAEQRSEMVRLTIQKNAHFELSRIDLDRPGPHYTIDALRLILAKHAHAHLTFIMGLDSLLALPTWRDPEGLLALAELAVAGRPLGSESQVLPAVPGLAARVRWLQAPLIDLASHQIRELARQGRSLRYLLTPEVVDYLEAQHLYR